MEILIDLLAFALISYIACFFYEIVYNLFFHPLRHFPGPLAWKALPIVHHVYNVMGLMDAKLEELHNRYGPVVRHGPDKLSFVSDAAWHGIYGRNSRCNDSEKFQLPKITSRGGNNGPESIINAADDNHARIRRQMAPAFSEKGIRDRADIFNRYFDRLSSGLAAIADSGDEVDLASWLDEWDADFLQDWAFSAHDEGKTSHLPVSSVYMWHFQTPMLRMIDQLPLLGSIAALFRPKAWKTCRQALVGHAKDTVLTRFAKPEKDRHADLLSLIVPDAKSPQQIPEAVGNVAVVIIAGSDAASTVMTGVLYWLCRTPHALQKVRAELRVAFASAHDIDTSTPASKTPYLAACLEEGLRLYTPSPGIFYRQVPPGPPVLIDGLVVPEKTLVGVPQRAALRSPANFAAPHRYAPERWLGAPEFAGDRRGASQPFHVGPRDCLGRRVAYTVMRVGLARVLFEFEPRLGGRVGAWERQRSWQIWEKRPLACRFVRPERAGTAGEG